MRDLKRILRHKQINKSIHSNKQTGSVLTLSWSSCVTGGKEARNNHFSTWYGSWQEIKLDASFPVCSVRHIAAYIWVQTCLDVVVNDDKVKFFLEKVVFCLCKQQRCCSLTLLSMCRKSWQIWGEERQVYKCFPTVFSYMRAGLTSGFQFEMQINRVKLI